jgi:hypothetical protein
MPKYNGVSEHLNWMLLEWTCTLLHSSKLQKNLWREAINHIVWLKIRTVTCTLPEGMTPYEMLYNKKPSMRGLHEWGDQVWVHFSSSTKLDERSKIRRWIGYNKISNGHRIYWPDKHSVTVEQSIKLTNDNVVFLSNLVAKPIQGENDLINKNLKNLQHNPKTKPLEDDNHQDDFVTDNAIDFVTDNATDKQNQQQVLLNQETNKPRSGGMRILTRYIRDIQSGIGMTDGRPGKTNLPTEMQILKQSHRLRRKQKILVK